MKLSTSQPSKSFTHVSSKLSMINQGLVNRQKVSAEDVKKIVKLQTIRKYFYDFIELSNDKEEIRRLDKIITQIEFQLQKLWGFSQNKNFHRWFDVPKCTCPKWDNADSLGSDFRTINPNCILHG
jgi:uncharacterized protein YfkK (UPF0435 family)